MALKRPRVWKMHVCGWHCLDSQEGLYWRTPLHASNRVRLTTKITVEQEIEGALSFPDTHSGEEKMATWTALSTGSPHSIRSQTQAFRICAVYIEDCEGWWLSGCHDSVAEHWRLKPEVSSVWLPATACRPFHFPLFLPHSMLLAWHIAAWRRRRMLA